MEGCFTVAVSLLDLSLQEKGCRADAFYQFFLLLCLSFLCFPLFASRFRRFGERLPVGYTVIFILVVEPKYIFITCP